MLHGVFTFVRGLVNCQPTPMFESGIAGQAQYDRRKLHTSGSFYFLNMKCIRFYNFLSSSGVF